VTAVEDRITAPRFTTRANGNLTDDDGTFAIAPLRFQQMKAVEFRLTTTEVGSDEVVLTLHGDVDLYTAPDLKAELIRLIEGGTTRIVVDLTSATFIDSTTLGVLLGALKRLRPAGGELAIVCPDPNIRKIFQITLLDRVFSIFETREDALGLF
jgi:anti-sigma B factor antagonist